MNITKAVSILCIVNAFEMASAFVKCLLQREREKGNRVY